MAPSPFRQLTPDTIEWRMGGGCVSLIGLPVFLFGLFLSAGAAGYVPVEGGRGAVTTRVLLGVIGGLSLALGFWIALWRGRLTLDRSQRAAIRHDGILIPMRTRQRSLSEFNAVVLNVVPDSDSGPDTYRVLLCAEAVAGAGRDLAIQGPRKYAEARILAEYLAQFLSLPLADRSAGHELLSRPGRGDSLRDRLRSGDDRAEPFSPRPAELKCKVNDSAGTVIIIIPGPKLALLPQVAEFVIRIAVIGFFCWLARIPPRIQIGIAVVLFVLGFVKAVLGKRNITVEASAVGITIARPKAWSTETTVVPAADILDVGHSTFENEVASVRRSSGVPETTSAGAERILGLLKKWIATKGIVVKSRRELITFGEGLPPEELQYLRWLLRKALGGR